MVKRKDYFGRNAVKKLALKTEHFRKRLDFAKRHTNWTTEQWQSVLWLDESELEFGKKRSQYIPPK